MTDDHDHDDHDGENPLAKYEELFRSKVDEIDSGSRRIGLHLRDIGMTMAPDFDTNGVQPVIVVNFAVGDVAWSDRVQNPQQDSTEGEFRRMAVQMEGEKFEDLRAEMERRLKEGKGVFGGEDEDGDVGN